MARANVYLPDELHEAARQADLNVSELTQHAIREELDRRERLRAFADFVDIESLDPPPTPRERAEAEAWAQEMLALARAAKEGARPRRSRTA